MSPSRVPLACVLVVLALSQCAAPTIDDVLWACGNENDCGPGFFCDLAAQACVEGKGPSGLRTDPFLVDQLKPDLAVNVVVQRDSEACFAITITAPTRLEAQTAGSCESSAIDTLLRFLMIVLSCSSRMMMELILAAVHRL